MFITITSSSFHRRAHKQTCTHMTRHATDHINKMKPKRLFCWRPWSCAYKSTFSHNLSKSYQKPALAGKVGAHAYMFLPIWLCAVVLNYITYFLIL
jgi:hypothetical protein